MAGIVTGNANESSGAAESKLRRVRAFDVTSVMLGSPTSSTLGKPRVNCMATRSDSVTLALISARAMPESTRVISVETGAGGVGAMVLPAVGACVGAKVASGLGAEVRTADGGAVERAVGWAVGRAVGIEVGRAVGRAVGWAVGKEVG